jgi:DnaJ-class molecular chaperone
MTALFKNYYVILGIRTDSTQEEIKKAYRTLASVYHPDKNKAPDAEEKFKEVKEAYDNLYDKIRRAIYDKKIVNFIENITLPEKYKDTLHSKCVQFVTKFRTKQEIGSLFDFKKFNITPGMITDIYDNVFCFKSGKYDDRLIGDDASPYSYVEYCGQHIAGNTAQQDMKRNVNKKAMSCNSKEPRYIFLFERKNDGFFYFCGLYKTDNHEIKNDRLVLYFKAVNLNIAASEKFTGKVLTTTH